MIITHIHSFLLLCPTYGVHFISSEAQKTKFSNNNLKCKGYEKDDFRPRGNGDDDMSANAQSNDNNSKLTFDRVASFLELRTNQVESVKTAMAQFESSMQAYNQLQDSSKAGEAWEKIQARHKAFEDLPDDWRCPRCKQPKEKFNPA